MKTNAATKTPAQTPSGIMPAPIIIVERSWAVQNASVMASFTKKIAATTAMTGMTSSSYQVTLDKKRRNFEELPVVDSGAETALFAMCLTSPDETDIFVS